MSHSPARLNRGDAMSVVIFQDDRVFRHPVRATSAPSIIPCRLPKIPAKGNDRGDRNMPKPRGPQPKEIHLTEKQRAMLREIVRGRLSPQAEALRARIILEAESGSRNEHIAKNLNIGRKAVRLWRKRWAENTEILAQIESEEDDKKFHKLVRTVLADDPRSGRPPTFTADQICRIVALACTSPDDSNRPVSHWTARELADEAIEREIVPSISTRTVGRFFLPRGPQTTQVQILAHQRTRKRS